jgi:tRNA-specific 2-thiouridylase
VAGRVFGRHNGIIHFTVGQRRGLGLGHEISGGELLYVIRLEPEHRRVVVGPWSALLKTNLKVREVNWLNSPPIPGQSIRVRVKVRSTQPAALAALRALDGGHAEVLFDEPQAGIAPGQACVFYDGERVLGGGWIAREAA